MIGGAVAGVFAVVMSYPFDLIKTRLHFEVAKSTSTATSAKPTFVSISKVIFREGAESGLLGSRVLGGSVAFYRGLDQLIPEAAIKVLLRFTAFKEIQNIYAKYVFGDPKTPLGFGSNVVCGSIAGAVEAVIVVQPFERGKTLRADFASPYAVWGKVMREDGALACLRSIYRGLVPCMGRQVGNQAVSFSVFYWLKNKWLEHSGAKDLNTYQRLGFGFIGGCAGAFTTMPLDVAKSIAQKQQGKEVIGTLSIIKDVYQRRGIMGLYTGLGPRLGRVGLDRAFGFLAFEWTLEFISKWRGEHAQ